MFLVTTGSLLACLQLLQVELANQHVAAVLLQASGERSGVSLTASALLLERLLLLGRNLLLWRLSRCRRAAKHGADSSTESVANSGTNCNASRSGGHLPKQTWTLLGLGWWVRHSRGLVMRSRRSSRGVSGSGLRSNWSGSSLSGHGGFLVCGAKRKQRELLYGKLVASAWAAKCRMSRKNRENVAHRRDVPSVPRVTRRI